MIVPVSTEAHHAAHLDPILAHLPHASARRRLSDVSLVASWGSLQRARRNGFDRHILAQHGAGQSYGGDKKSREHPSYPGGSANGDVSLFLVPNEHAAGRWRRAYPRASVAVVGSPRLDVLPAREHTRGEAPGPVVAVAFHWDGHMVPELKSAQGAYWKAIADLTRHRLVIGHGHPKRRDLGRLYRSIKVPYVPTFDDVCRRADVYVCDNSSTLFEFASTGRPVVVLNLPEYRRTQEGNHGLRFEVSQGCLVVSGPHFCGAAHVGIQVDHPADLRDAISEALRDTPEQQAARDKALSVVYAYRTGAAQRAAEAILEWAGAQAQEAA